MKLPFVYAVLLLLLLSTNSCSGQPPLSGTIVLDDKGEWASTVYLIDPGAWKAVGSSYIGIIIDSAVIDADGHFAFDALPDVTEPMLLQIAVQRQGERFLNRLDNEPLSDSNYFPLVWQNGEQIVLNAQAAYFQASLKMYDPSAQNAAMLELRNIRHTAFAEHLREAHATERHEEDILKNEEALLTFQQALMQFSEDCIYLLPALTAIRWISVAGNYERIPEFMVAQAERWLATFPKHLWAQQLAQVGNRNTLPVLVGDLIPDYAMPMWTGDTLALQSLLGEKLTLLDLWASWCAPCRVQNRDFLVPLWEEFHEDGFQILAYGLEASPKAWATAIETDGAHRWLHASDLQGDDAPFFERLRITTIPANFLLDAEGRVVAKNLHGKELMEFVQSKME